MTRRSPWGAFALAVVVIGAVFGIERFAPPPSEGPRPVEASSEARPVAGSRVCAVGDGREGTTLDTLVARRGDPGAQPAEVELVEVREGEVDTTSLPTLFPASHTLEGRDVEGESSATWVRWNAASVDVNREWRWEGGDDLPPATVAGPCAEPTSSEWVVPGMSSAGGNEARLRLANPYRTDATVAIRFVTTEGTRAPIALQNHTVPARSVREINVNEVIPEENDLAAVVDVATGRLSVEGYQITRSAIGGIDGGSLLAAAPAPAETWTVPWIVDRATATSWLWIANTGDRTAPVELTLHTPAGGEVPAGLAELTVPPGELRRVELGGTFPEDTETAAITVRSDGAPVVVSAGTRFAPAAEEDDEDVDELEELDELDEEADEEEATTVAADTGFAIQLGVAEPDGAWSVSGGATEGREEWLQLVNPGGEAAVVDVVLFDGAQLVEPEELQDLDVGAGSAMTVSVTDHLDDVASWTAFVNASEGSLAVGRVGRDEAGGPMHLVAVQGIAGSSARPTGDVLAGLQTPGMVRHLGTSLGLRRADPFDAQSTEDELDPLPPDDAELDRLFEPDGDPDADVEGEAPDGEDPGAGEPDQEASPDDGGDGAAEDG